MDSQSGETNNTLYAAEPNQVYGYSQPGAGSARKNALLYQLDNDAAQAELAASGGGKRRRSRRHHTKKRGLSSHKSKRYYKKGGQQAGAELEVPSFTQVGPATSPLNSTSASVAANQAALDAKVSACNDCYATGTCDTSMGCPQQGGRKKRNSSMRSRRRPFAMTRRNVAKSPFKTVSSVRKTLKAYNSGRRIGFTQRSSLRSMGLIPRKDGTYRLGSKYARH